MGEHGYQIRQLCPDGFGQERDSRARKGGSPLAGKKVLVLGDSVSADAYGNYAKWVTVLRDEGFFPSDVLNNSQHATGFVARYTGDSADAQNDFIDRITAVTDKSSYDLVVVFGGINDYIQSIPLGGGTGETDRDTYFKPAVDYFFTYLIQNFTQARIAVLSPLRTYNVYKNTAGVYRPPMPTISARWQSPTVCPC